MSRTPSFQSLKEVVEQQLLLLQQAFGASRGPAVTISRATGCGALLMAKDLARELERRSPSGRRWAVVDRELIRRVAEDSHLTQVLGQRFREDEVVTAGGGVSSVLGENPFAQPLPVPATRSVRRLCALGHVIIVDRAACLMAAKLERTLHVRLVGSFARRVARVARDLHLGPQETRAYVEQADASRAGYLKERLGVSIDNPAHYHLVVNTDRYADHEVVHTIACSVEQLGRSRSPTTRHPTAGVLRRNAVA